ncbi:permease [Prauserella marina]|uniref:Gluconate:H+ symporter, GntP family n=1 Tax=Prauserella marina TaxID=530584 RepID=A0A222VNI8_9PSEU|nr:GntP family permease [Prauserella marina]ASR35479.1 permease [Prauserella marina]PWV84702.1 GntP family gluconate:H+ symporter [Prauserella marina]SDC15362.1 gluconate:H+ symporter, GntP family [Prauserella marina]
METEEWTQTLGAGPLLGIAAGAIAVLLFLIITLRVHAFLALVVVSAATAFATGIPAGDVIDTLTEGFGSTLASVALLVGLGAILGRLVEVSGGAQTLTDALIRRFGEQRAPFALGIASLLFGFPIFFDAGLVVMLPIVFAVARRLGGGVLRYGLPAAGAFSVMHIYVPPHPGPVAASGLLQADVGLVILFGLLIAIPTWFLTSYLYGLWIGRKLVLPVPDLLSGGEQEEDKQDPPKPATVVAMLLLPLVLIFADTGLNTAGEAGWVDSQASWFNVARAIGSTPIALLITVFVASYVLGTRRGQGKEMLEKLVDSALGPVCSIILITGAGGMFGGVLRASGIGDALSDAMADLGLPVIVAAYLIATVLRIAQGSATVALTTAAGLVQPIVLTGGFNSVEVVALVLALAAGSVTAGHVNDSGFWLVGRFFGMDVKTTLKTWTVMQTTIGLMGFGLASLLFVIA